MKMFNDICDEIDKVDRLMNISYGKGYDRAYKECKITFDKAYQEGSNDAWECAKKIHFTSTGDLIEIFGSTGGWVNYSASEAISKIKEYEEKKAKRK